MRLITLMILIVLTAVPAFGHEVQPPPMKESCDAAKWLGNTLAGTGLSDPEYGKLDALASKAFAECERYQRLDDACAEVQSDMAAVIERAARVGAVCDW